MVNKVSYRSQPSPQHAHIEWVELYGDGILHECAVMRRDANGNMYFFQTNHIDGIDRQRLASIVSDRNAGNFELWDLMSNKTLGNGMNALAYFHQLVKILSPQGKIMDPRLGQIGVTATGTVNVNPEAQ